MFFILRFVFVLVFVTNCFALSIAPTRADLTIQKPITTLTLTNDNNEPIVLQLHVVKWTQNNYQELEVPSDDILITPQIFTLKPNSSQLIRLGMESVEAGPLEQAYRLIIQEVKSPFKLTSNGIYFLLKLSVPIIIGATTPTVERIHWKLNKTNQKNNLDLEAINQGNNVIFINKISLISKSGQYITPPFSTFSYLLPHSKKKWTVSSLNKHLIDKVKANINSKVVTYDVS